MLIKWFNSLFKPMKNEGRCTERVVKGSRYESISIILDDYCTSQPFIKAGFNLSTVAIDTKIPYHQLTGYFNNYLGVSFNDWKNALRIDYAVDKIKKGEAKNYTLETIAYDCGFLSRSNFHNAFYKRMNVKPSQYLKQF